jgi:quercetin dioxygenase-like cupin family protein
MNRKEFLTGSSAVGLISLMPGITCARSLGAEGLEQRMAEPELANSLWYIGHLMSILISSKDTGGAFSLIHGYEIQGLEPPPHTHTKEDESFYLLTGEITYIVGNEVLNAKSGNWVFLPRNIQHSFKVITEQAEVLIHLSPGGFEGYFREMSEPAKELSIPPRPQGPPDVKRIIETASRYGVLFPNIG